MEPIIYLFFKGNCLEAMTHYANTLGGKIQDVLKNVDLADPNCRAPGGDDIVLHMAMALGNTTIMASDNSDDVYDKPQGFRVALAPTSQEEFNRVYSALAEDAEVVETPPEETFWAESFTMFTDKYGTPWMLNFEGNKAQGEQ